MHRLAAGALLLLAAAHTVAADFKNSGECLVEAYKKHKPARIIYWTQFHAQRIPNIPENRELRETLLKDVTVQEDLLEIEFGYYLLHEGANDQMMELAPFTVPYVPMSFVDDDERDILLKNNERYAELETESTRLAGILSKYGEGKVRGLTQDGVEFVMKYVLPKLAADLAASRDRIAGSCDAYYRE